jgi:chromosome segregation ATPase
MRDLIATTQELNTLKSQCAETRKAFEQSSYDVLRLSMELQASQAKAQELSQAGEAKAQELSQAGEAKAQELSKAEETEAKLIAQLAELQKDLLELTQNHELLEAKVHVTETQRDNALDSKLSCALELQSARANVANITSRYAETQTLLDQASRETQSLRAELQANAQETRELQSQLENQQSELDRCTAQNAELQAQLGGSNATADQQHHALASLHTTNEDLQTRLSACEEKSAKLAASDQDMASLITELAACQNSLLKATVDQSLSEADHDQTKLRLEKALDAVLACKLEQGTLQDELASVMTRLSESESARQRCDEHVAELRENARTMDSELQDTVSELRNKNEQLERQKVNSEVGSFVMEKAVEKAGLADQVKKLETCIDRNKVGCAKAFFEHGDSAKDEHVKKLFGRLVGLTTSICEKEGSVLRPGTASRPDTAARLVRKTPGVKKRTPSARQDGQPDENEEAEERSQSGSDQTSARAARAEARAARAAEEREAEEREAEARVARESSLRAKRKQDGEPEDIEDAEASGSKRSKATGNAAE